MVTRVLAIVLVVAVTSTPDVVLGQEPPREAEIDRSNPFAGLVEADESLQATVGYDELQATGGGGGRARSGGGSGPEPSPPSRRTRR